MRVETNKRETEEEENMLRDLLSPNGTTQHVEEIAEVEGKRKLRWEDAESKSKLRTQHKFV